jgi:DNA anti-recombination protein RmuC
VANAEKKSLEVASTVDTLHKTIGTLAKDLHTAQEAINSVSQQIQSSNGNFLTFFLILI